MSLVAIITARGGSKRIPRKNIREFMGKPMIAYAIDAAKEASIFDEIMVSTEDEEIAEVSRKYGASVPFMRSQETANDFATTFDVIDEVVRTYKSMGKEFDVLCCIYPCVPFLSGEMLRAAYAVIGDYDAVQPICRFPSPVEWAMYIEDGLIVPKNRDVMNVRSQDLRQAYFDVGMFYFCRTEKIYERNSLVPKRTVPYIVKPDVCQDIDTIEDWEEAEKKYRFLHFVGLL